MRRLILLACLSACAAWAQYYPQIGSGGGSTIAACSTSPPTAGAANSYCYDTAGRTWKCNNGSSACTLAAQWAASAITSANTFTGTQTIGTTTIDPTTGVSAPLVDLQTGCLAQEFSASGTITAHTWVTRSGNSVATAGTGGGPGYGVALTGGTGTVKVCFQGIVALTMDGTTVVDRVAIPSTSVGGDGTDSGQTSILNISSTLGVIGRVLVGCTGAACSAQISLNGPNTLGGSVSGAGTVASVGLVGTANQITVTGASPITGSGSWTLSFPSAMDFSGNTWKIPTAAGFTASATSMLGYDSTAGLPHLWFSAADHALGTAALVNTGTSGGTVPFLNGINTWSAAQTFGTGSFSNGGTGGVVLSVNSGTDGNGAEFIFARGCFYENSSGSYHYWRINTSGGCNLGNYVVLGSDGSFGAHLLSAAFAPTATANYGTLSIGGGPFDGSTTGKFVGAAAGTNFAMNAAVGSTADLANWQVGGVMQFQFSATGVATFSGLKTTGSATGKTVVCVDTTTGILYASTSGVACAN